MSLSALHMCVLHTSVSCVTVRSLNLAQGDNRLANFDAWSGRLPISGMCVLMIVYPGSGPI